MKPSTGTIGLLIFTAIATAAFVLMAKRPAVDSNALVFGMPKTAGTSASSSTPPTTAEPKVEAAKEQVEDKPDTQSTAAEAEPKTEEVTAPATTPTPAESTTPSDTTSTETTKTKASEAEPEKQEAPAEATESEPTEKEGADKPAVDDVIQKTTIDAENRINEIIKSASEIKIPTQ
jgi:flagellar biosynthesis GTPase FlhF